MNLNLLYLHSRLARQALGSNEQQQLRIRRGAWAEPAEENAGVCDLGTPRGMISDGREESESSRFVSEQSQRTAGKAVESKTGKAAEDSKKEKTKLFLKLFKIAYEADAEISPENIRLRQLVALMKQKDFSADEVEYYISKKLKKSSSISSTEANSHPTSLRDDKMSIPPSRSLVGVAGVPVKVVRERRMTKDANEDEQWPSTSVRPGSADTKKVLKISASAVSIGGYSDAISKTGASTPRSARSTADTGGTSTNSANLPSSSSVASIFVKSSWVPRNEDEVGYLEQEISRIDSVIESHGKISKQAKLLEAPRHSLVRRIAKYKAEQLRAARKASNPPPPLPSETAPAPTKLSNEERKRLDVAAGWRVNKDHPTAQGDLASKQQDEAESMSPRSAKLDLANDMFRSRIGKFSGGPGKLSYTVDSIGSDIDSKRSYSSVGEASHPVVQAVNREAAERIKSLSNQLATVRAAKAAAMSSSKEEEPNYRRNSQRKGTVSSVVGAAAAPFANDLTWDKMDRICLDHDL